MSRASLYRSRRAIPTSIDPGRVVGKPYLTELWKVCPSYDQKSGPGLAAQVVREFACFRPVVKYFDSLRRLRINPFTKSPTTREAT
jgi:hypothetical protein